jgi:lysophospholipase L1-like esterase
VASTYYYSIELLDSTELKRRRYNAFFQISPNQQNAVIPKPEGVFRILLLGGSTTRGKGARGYAAPLEEMLLSKHPKRKIEVVNAGKQFYNSQHSIMQYLFYLKDMDPDMIILFHGMNDLLPSFTMPPWSSSPFRKDYGHFTGILNLIRPYPKTFEKFLYGFFYADLRKSTLKPVSFSDFRSLYSFRRNLETLIEITKCKGIHLILSNQAHYFSNKNETNIHYLGYPQWFSVDSEHYADEVSWYKGMDLFNRTTKETAEKYSIPFVDQVSAFKGKKELFRDVMHMTHEGTELKARLFFEKISELGLFERNE